MTPAIDLAARRRQAVTRDAQTVMADIIDSVTALHATVAGWPHRYGKQSHGLREPVKDALGRYLYAMRGGGCAKLD